RQWKRPPTPSAYHAENARSRRAFWVPLACRQCRCGDTFGGSENARPTAAASCPDRLQPSARHLLTYSPTHLLTYSPTHLLTAPPPYPKYSGSFPAFHLILHPKLARCSS